MYSATGGFSYLFGYLPPPEMSICDPDDLFKSGEFAIATRPWHSEPILLRKPAAKSKLTRHPVCILLSKQIAPAELGHVESDMYFVLSNASRPRGPARRAVAHRALAQAKSQPLRGSIPVGACSAAGGAMIPRSSAASPGSDRLTAIERRPR